MISSAMTIRVDGNFNLLTRIVWADATRLELVNFISRTSFTKPTEDWVRLIDDDVAVTMV